MAKKIILFIILLAITTAVSLVIITQRNIDKAEIARVTNELAKLTQEKQALANKVAQLDKKQLQLNKIIEEKNKQIKNNQVQIAKLEKERAAGQWQVRQLNSENALEKKFAETYPQVIHANNFGIVRKPMKPNSKILLPYYVIPAWFTETFIIEHQNMLAYQAEINEYKKNEQLYGNVVTLKSQVIQLQTEKTNAYRKGYEQAFSKYEEVNKAYIELLKKPPKVEIKAPALWPTVGAALIGLATGVAL